MKRITKLQSEIYNAHVKAWKNDDWDNLDFDTVQDYNKEVERGKVSQGLWNHVIHNETNIPIFSQIMMNSKHLSGKAQQEIRNGFKRVLTHYNIF